MTRKFNQVKARRIKNAGQKDEKENMDLANLLRTLPNIKVHREWFILFDTEGRFIRVQEHEPTGDELSMVSPRLKYRHPDFMIFRKLDRNRRGKLLCCMENDGQIHRIKAADTIERNEQYATAKIPLLVINKERVQISVFDHAYNMLKLFLEGLNE